MKGAVGPWVGLQPELGRSQVDGHCNVVLKRGRGKVGLGGSKRKWQHIKSLPRISSSLSYIGALENPNFLFC